MGERFGNYELLEKVAVGGMAEIFKARAMHARGIEKLVCIKRIHPALSADRIFVAMFIDEARLGVTMAHGNIVPVFDFGYVDGHYFLAMEYVEGLDLATICGRARVVEVSWPPELAVYVVMEILEGLAYAHQKRDDQGRPLELVHRDVSPSNVLISEDGQVKLLDFGIARSQAREFETRTGVIKGKPGYMSPEQAAGHAVDARADVWSCGAVLYELLTGQRLKDGRRKLDDEAIDAVLTQALQANRDRRYENARQLQEALARILELRRWRPYPRDLAAFIQRVHSTQAPGANWDMKSRAVEQHLADALESARPAGDDPHRTATARITEAVSAVDPGTALTTTTEDRGPRTRISRRGTTAAIVASLGAAVIVAAILVSTLYDDGGGLGDPKRAADLSRADAGIGAAAGSEIVPPAVDIRSTPAGARILVDGDDTGKTTPATLALEAGDHRISLELAGYGRWSGRATVSDRGAPPIAATLSRPASAIVVRTAPVGAEVLLDGVPRGPSPVGLEGIEPGRHTISARMPGRVTAEEEIELAEDERRDITLELAERIKAPVVPQKRAVLNVISDPWSHVTLDGRAIGQTPIRGHSTTAGRHVVVMTNPVKNVTRTVTFSVKPGETRLISEKLSD